MYIIGGWLGSGPFAANDVHILKLDNFEWVQPDVKGCPPGPCNMHSTDLIGETLFLFRGGDGKDYLNDLHAFDLKTNVWYEVNSSGNKPPPRANHSSAVIKSTLYIFGGWDGSKRLNDLYALNTETLVWSEVISNSILPSPRAGMSLCNVNDKLFLFGGSGPSASSFNDLHVYNSDSNQWSLVQNFNLDQSLKPRAGHTMTAYDHHLFIIGGSYAQTYFKEISSIEIGKLRNLIYLM